jgi:2-keto-4-pentenoate hydratase/2-oxohepta-3-ene-1,7-dioic acid hydratase in catechol pathway
VKLARFRTGEGTVRAGALGDGVLHVLGGGVDDLAGLLDAEGRTLVDAGRAAVGRTDNVVQLDAVRFLSPIATPSTIRDFYAFESHVRAGRAWRGLDMDPAWYAHPAFYFSNPYAACGEGEISIPPGCGQFDFELEVAAVLGAGGKDVSVTDAGGLIAGYCVMNDWSARDLQRREMTLGLGPVKGKDSATGLGPWLVTPDELAEHRSGKGYRLRMSCAVNDRPYAQDWWSNVHWSFEEMVAYASLGAEVRAGDVLGSGTCGTGCIVELSQSRSPEDYPWLTAGDVVTASIEGLGTLRNVVTARRTGSPAAGG